MLKKKQLSIILSKLKEIPKPKPSLEQYTIPSELASEIINLAYLSGDIENKRVLDLGCGSGRLTIGCSLMGAREVIGIDIDPYAIKVAMENVELAEKLTNQKLEDRIRFFHQDVSKVKERVDTVIQNPPFGIQRRHADRTFLKKALECGNKIYSLHRSYEKSRKFLTGFITANGGRVERIIRFKFKIPHMFRFHEKPSVEYDVDLFIISKVR